MPIEPSSTSDAAAAGRRGGRDGLAAIPGDQVVFHRSPDTVFDRLTRLTERLLDVPIALISLEHDGHQRLAGSRDLPGPLGDRRRGSPMAALLHATADDHGLVVEDVRTVDLLSTDLSAVGAAGFAGHPLVTTSGETIGVLCAIADGPRTWSAEDRQLLADIAAIASTEAELHARAGRLSDVADRLTTIADPLQATEDAVASLANIADRAGDARVERLASLARQRLHALREDTAALHVGLSDIAGSDLPAGGVTVNLSVRVLRAVRLVEAVAPEATLEVVVLERHLLVPADAITIERRLVRLLSAAATQAPKVPVRIELDRDDDAAVVRLGWNLPVPVPELARLAGLAHALHAGRDGSAAALSTLAGRTTTTLAHGEAATGRDGTDVVAHLPLAPEPNGRDADATMSGIFS